MDWNPQPLTQHTLRMSELGTEQPEAGEEAFTLTPEQQAFLSGLMRGMRCFLRVFAVGWLLVCTVMAGVAGWMLVAPRGEESQHSRAVAAGVLLVAVVFTGGGFFFLRFLQRSLQRLGDRLPLQQSLRETPRLPTHEHPSVEATGQRQTERLISTSAHIGLQVAAGVVGILVAMAVLFGMVLRSEWSAPLRLAAITAVCGAATTLPRLLVSLVPARCPQCSGRAYCRGSIPVRYVCSCCGNTHNTGISLRSSHEVN